MSDVKHLGPAISDAALAKLADLANDLALPCTFGAGGPFDDERLHLIDSNEVPMADLFAWPHEKPCPFDEYLLAIVNAGPALLAELVRLRRLERQALAADPDWLDAVTGQRCVSCGHTEDEIERMRWPNGTDRACPNGNGFVGCAFEEARHAG